MTPDEKKVQYIKIALIFMGLIYIIWRVETIIGLLK